MTNDEAKPIPSGTEDSPSKISKPKSAWLPLTPRGVAAFGGATISRVLVVELIFAALAAGTIVWFLVGAWFPTVRAAIRQLPDEGMIRQQELALARGSSRILAEGRYLAFVLQPEKQPTDSPLADVRVEFHRKSFRVCSLLGCLVFYYPKNWSVAFNRRELEPWWGAWEPAFLGLSAVAVIVALLLAWALLATLYFAIAWLVAFFADRQLSWAGSWRLASAALMPGALLLNAAILLYGLGALDLVRLAGLAVLHLVVGWMFVIVSPLNLPPVAVVASRPANPFGAPQPESLPNTREKPEK